MGFEMSNTLYKCLLWQPAVAAFGFWVFILFCPKMWGHEVGWLLWSWVAEGLLVLLGLGLGGSGFGEQSLKGSTPHRTEQFGFVTKTGLEQEPRG